MEVNVDVSYDGNHNLRELINKSEPGSYGSNKSAILVFLFLTSLFSHLLIKQKPDVTVKIFPVAIFFFLRRYARHLEHATPYHEINVCSRSHFFTIELISKLINPCILLISTRNQFFCQFHSLCIVNVTRIIDYYCYFQVM